LGTAINDVRQESQTIAGYDGTLAAKENRKYQIFPWNADSSTLVPFTTRNRRDELIEVVTDPDAGGKQLTATYRYYNDVAAGTPNYGRVKQIERADRSWVRFEYDSQGRVTRSYTPFKDSPAPASAAGVPIGDYRLTEVTYGSNPTQTITESLMVGGTSTVIGRRFKNIDDSGPSYTVIKD